MDLFKFLNNSRISVKLGFCFALIIVSMLVVGIIVIVMAKGSVSNMQYAQTNIIPKSVLAQDLKLNIALDLNSFSNYVNTSNKQALEKHNGYSAACVGMVEKLKTLVTEDEMDEFSAFKAKFDNFSQVSAMIVDRKQKMSSLYDEMEQYKTNFNNGMLQIRSKLERSTGNQIENQHKIVVVSEIVRAVETAKGKMSNQEAVQQILAKLNSLFEQVKVWAAAVGESSAFNMSIENFQTYVKNAKVYYGYKLESDKAVGDVEVLNGQLTESLNLFIESAGASSNESLSRMGKYQLHIINMFVLVLIIIIVISVVSSMTIGRRVGKKAAVTLDNINLISQGDLTSDSAIDSKDEFGQMSDALSKMTKKLRDVIGKFREGVEMISQNSSEIAKTSQVMSDGAGVQASSTEEVSSSIEELSAGLNQNTDNARQTEKIALMVLQNIKQTSEASQQSMAAMKEIAGKISIIDEIAFQTNILALNAAVEAARAGEQGKGFAVVASEVRKLAERSAVAAADIDKVSKEGVMISENAERLLKNVIPEIEKTADLVREIAAAGVEQSTGIGQITNAVQQLNEVTQRYAAEAEELAATSQQLDAKSEELKQSVVFFKVKDDKKGGNFQNFNSVNNNSTFNKSTKYDGKINTDRSKSYSKTQTNTVNDNPALASSTSVAVKNQKNKKLKKQITEEATNKGAVINLKDDASDSDFERF